MGLAKARKSGSSYDDATVRNYIEAEIKLIDDCTPDVVVGDFRLDLEHFHGSLQSTVRINIKRVLDKLLCGQTHRAVIHADSLHPGVLPGRFCFSAPALNLSENCGKTIQQGEKKAGPFTLQ